MRYKDSSMRALKILSKLETFIEITLYSALIFSEMLIIFCSIDKQMFENVLQY